MNRAKSLFKNTLILGIGNVLPKIFSLLTLPIITGLLYKSEYGTYDLIVSLTTLILPVATLQLQAAAFRFLIDSKNTDNQKTMIVISNIIIFTFFSSILSLVILFFCLGQISFHVRILITIYYFLDIFVTTLRQITRGLGRNIVYSISVIISSIFELLSIIFFVIIFKMRLIGAMLSLIVGLISALIYIIIKIKIYNYINIKLYSKRELKTMLSYSWPLIPNSLASWIISLSDRLIITFNMGIEANAVYAIANKLPNMLGIFQSTFTLAWQENASISINDEDSSKYYSEMFDIIFRLLTGGLALLIGFAPILFNILIKGNYLESYSHMTILLMAALFSGISSFLGGIYIANKKTKEIGITTIMAAFINAIINISLIKYIGIYAASISTLISNVVLAIFRMISIQKIQKISYNLKNIIISIILLALMCLVCVKRNLTLSIINIIISLFIFVILNFSLIRIFVNKLKSKYFTNNNL